MPLANRVILDALAKVGEFLDLDRDVEILVVGGAAGVLTGQLPAAWTTADVDVLHCRMPQDRDAVLVAAERAGHALGLPPSWMSEDVGLFLWALPADWTCRRVLVAQFGRLVVYAAGRLDLLVMKFLAHRERDLEHLARMNVLAHEREEVLRHMRLILDREPEQRSRIEMAIEYANAWETP